MSTAHAIAGEVRQAIEASGKTRREVSRKASIGLRTAQEAVTSGNVRATTLEKLADALGREWVLVTPEGARLVRNLRAGV